MPFKKPPKRTDREKAAFAAWLKDPVSAVKDWFGVTPDDWQGDALNGIFGAQDRCAFKAAHGVGKTTLFAWAGWIFLECFENSRLVMTAPTFAQLHDVLLPEYGKWHSKMGDTMKNEWNISGGHIRHKIAPYEWFGVARTSNKPANLQGFHGTYLMIQGDEASAIPKPVFEVIEGTLSEAGDEGKIAKLLIGGNPNFTTGELYDAFNKDSELYHRVTVSGDPELLSTLNIEQGAAHPQHGNVYYSKRVKPRYVSTMAKKFGRDSAIFDVRVRGLFPRAEEDAIIPFEWAQRATLREMPTYDRQADGVTLVVDVSRGGAAESVVGYFRKGICYKIKPEKTNSTTKTVNMTHDAVLEIHAAGLRLENIIVDEPGVGGGVIDGLRALNYPVTPYNGSRPMVQGVDPDDDCRMFQNVRARDWWHLRRKLEQNEIPLIDDEITIFQLSSAKYIYNSRERIQVESKQDMKDRNVDSPDRGDVIVMGTAPWYASDVVTVPIAPEDIQFGGDRPTPDEGLSDFNIANREFVDGKTGLY